MAGKTSTGAEPSWRPLAKLSGLIARRSSAKGRKPREASDERSSIFGFKRESRVYPDEEEDEEAAPEFKPLEVDVGALEGLRLPPSWLHVDTDNANRGRKQQAPAAADASTSPIADFFGRAVFETPNSAEKPPPAYSQTYGNHFTRKPVPVLEAGTGSTSHARVSTETSRVPADAQSIYSVLDRGRPIEPRHAVPDVPKVPRTARHSFSAAETGIALIHQTDAAESVHVAKLPQSSMKKFATAEPSQPPQRLPRTNRASAAIQRHSMYEGAASPTESAAPKPKPTTIAPRSVSAAPTDRIQQWQKPSVSRSSSAAQTQPPSVHATAPLQSAAPVRRLSARGGVANNRLAWIKELEEKRSAGVNRDLVVLKKQAGSVSDKLAMFETKQTLAAPQARLPPLTRTNSTNRFSGAGYESIFSAESNTGSASQRTSIDTVRTNQRESSVMSHFDDSFREKLETLMGSSGPDKDKNNTSGPSRTNSRSVSGESKPPTKPELSTEPNVVIKPEAAEGPSSAEPEKLVQPEVPTEPAEAERQTEPEAPAHLEEPAPTESKVVEAPEMPAESAASIDPESSIEVPQPAEPASIGTSKEPEAPKISVETEASVVVSAEAKEPVKTEEPVEIEAPIKNETPMEAETPAEPEFPAHSDVSKEISTLPEPEKPKTVELETPSQPESSGGAETLLKPALPVELIAPAEPAQSALPVELKATEEVPSPVKSELSTKVESGPADTEEPKELELPMQAKETVKVPAAISEEVTQAPVEEKVIQAPQNIALPASPQPEEDRSRVAVE
ncbi:hypothetical protein HJFPF1_04056 [Paramyrothecium foliicola]|nr:hypothetical protein HJFPF1_04056 [Paramyrothecium foliicola]